MASLYGKMQTLVAMHNLQLCLVKFRAVDILGECKPGVCVFQPRILVKIPRHAHRHAGVDELTSKLFPFVQKFSLLPIMQLNVVEFKGQLAGVLGFVAQYIWNTTKLREEEYCMCSET